MGESEHVKQFQLILMMRQPCGSLNSCTGIRPESVRAYGDMQEGSSRRLLTSSADFACRPISEPLHCLFLAAAFREF